MRMVCRACTADPAHGVALMARPGSGTAPARLPRQPASPYANAWQEATAEVNAAIVRARTDPDTTRQLLALFTLGCQTLDRFEEERSYLFGIGIPAAFLPTARDSAVSISPPRSTSSLDLVPHPWNRDRSGRRCRCVVSYLFRFRAGLASSNLRYRYNFWPVQSQCVATTAGIRPIALGRSVVSQSKKRSLGGR